MLNFSSCLEILSQSSEINFLKKKRWQGAIKKLNYIILFILISGIVSGCSRYSGGLSGDAEKYTIKFNEDSAAALKFDDLLSYEDAKRGFTRSPAARSI
jgi:hypothetical protein